MQKLSKDKSIMISGGSVADCVGRYTAGAFLGALAGASVGPVGAAIGAGAGAYTATPSSCSNQKK
ncbi:hypothetical protein NW981_01720 [Staphylococcus aureus]|uniref:Blp family class II bacteriocin n=1 Tax=Staphylococcus aureus TaxID=1280 RepID=UPI00215BCDE2|nr:Blp family class II bacteriocin [Staphylococcus aureus]UVI92982.1 hypothetical protein NW981_01720 [Staphylococcus aureus]